MERRNLKGDDIDPDAFNQRDWKEFYGRSKESVPSNASLPLGKELMLTMPVIKSLAGLGQALLLWRIWPLSAGYLKGRAVLKRRRLEVSFAQRNSAVSI